MSFVFYGTRFCYNNKTLQTEIDGKEENTLKQRGKCIVEDESPNIFDVGRKNISIQRL